MFENDVVKPNFCDEVAFEEILVYLDNLKESGEINMYGAGNYLREQFGLNKRDAASTLKYWMKTFPRVN